jgi:1-acyl-sn-glycerol-3-phosphate acyltransferase
MWLYRLNRLFGPVVGLYWRLGLHGAVDAIPSTGPLIVASNHASYLDPWFIGMTFPRPIRYLVTHRWYYKSPTWNAVFRAYGTEPVRADDPLATVEAVCKLLSDGTATGIFPEGRISHDGRLQRFRPGLAWIAARSGAPVVPIGIRGSFESLPRHRRLPGPVRVTVHVGNPMVYPGGPSEDRPSPEASQTFQDHVFREIARLAGQLESLEAPPARRLECRRDADGGAAPLPSPKPASTLPGPQMNCSERAG